ncbi:F-box/kelch-repeat protein [Forsythia ovata]|uniref:F-box/kelch-repeat protein n=1 Tax=Forsythia ovata TaxID=205694 RepID=A0ABD1RI78_9LAMI
MEETNWNYFDSDLTELILSHLPIPSIIRSSLVCKSWQSIITSSSFNTRVLTRKRPWFFLYGKNNVFLKNNQVFAFDPESDEWIKLPVSASLLSKDLFTGSNGFCFTITHENFSFKPVLSDSWSQTSPLRFSRCNPLLGVYDVPDKRSKLPRFIVAGGASFIGNLVDLGDRLAVEIYNPNQDFWELCPPLPANFWPGNSSQWLCSALFKRKFYVFGIYSFFVSSFDLEKRFWTSVQTLRPPGTLFSYLISLHDRLILAGLCNNIGSSPSFVLWKIDEETLEFSEMEIMPQELLTCLFDSSDNDDRFASLKCVGFGNLIYVFNEEHHKHYPACVFEMSNYSGKCRWRRLPSLPLPVNKFHKIVSFCSNVYLDVFRNN